VKRTSVTTASVIGVVKVNVIPTLETGVAATSVMRVITG
jgi:hypothetical protein